MITFERPDLLVYCLSALAIFLLLYWRVRPRPTSMAYFTLWDEAVRASMVNRALPLIRMVRFLTTFLLLVTCALLIAGPVVQRPRAKDWAIVLDLSPSMDVREETGETRLELARRLIERFVAGLEPGDRCALVAATGRPVVVARPDRPRAWFSERLARLETQVDRADLVGAIDIARSQGFEPVVFTDGQEPADGPELERHARVARVGSARANRAIVDLTVRRPSRHGVEVAARTAAFGEPSSEAWMLRLEDPEGKLLAETESVPDGWAVLEVPRRASGRVRLRSVPGDACTWDDDCWLELPSGQPRAIALSVPAGETFHPALNVAAHVLGQAFDLSMREVEANEPLRDDEVLVKEGGRLTWDEVPPEGAIAIGCELEGSLRPVAQDEVVVRGVVLDVDRDHPVSAGLPLDQLRVRTIALVPEAAPSAVLRALVAGPRSLPLIYAARRDGKRVFGTTFPIQESDLPTGMMVVLLGRMLEALAAPETHVPSFLRAGPGEGPWSRTATDAASGGMLDDDLPSPPIEAPRVFWREGETRGAPPTPVEAFLPAESDIGPRLSPGWSGAAPRPRTTEPHSLADVCAILLLMLLFARGLLDFLLGV